MLENFDIPLDKFVIKGIQYERMERVENKALSDIFYRILFENIVTFSQTNSKLLLYIDKDLCYIIK